VFHSASHKTSSSSASKIRDADVTTHFLATEIIIFVDTETNSSCILLQGKAITQHSYEKSIYSSPTCVAPPLTLPCIIF
jgi:hypothetical protein